MSVRSQQTTARGGGRQLHAAVSDELSVPGGGQVLTEPSLSRRRSGRSRSCARGLLGGRAAREFVRRPGRCERERVVPTWTWGRHACVPTWARYRKLVSQSELGAASLDVLASLPRGAGAAARRHSYCEPRIAPGDGGLGATRHGFPADLVQAVLHALSVRCLRTLVSPDATTDSGVAPTLGAGGLPGAIDAWPAVCIVVEGDTPRLQPPVPPAPFAAGPSAARPFAPRANPCSSIPAGTLGREPRVADAAAAWSGAKRR